ncbi:MAG: xanthine dehydrogenase family protein molybdopterin-binding subunit [Alphaproteobacteria bacterium]|nr:xanthine dehydrogenase family protein molybdopterin-binding subunit [Alphaproteobacteria bacterium]
MGEYALGQPVARFEDPRLIQGGGRYVDDVFLPNMAHGAVLRSRHAHAKILKLDVERARQAPGVLAVLTHADWVQSGFADLPRPTGKKKRDGSPLFRPPLPGLTGDRVRWVGDYVAFVVAETYAQAQDALELIEVEYQPLPAVFTAQEALKPGAPLVHDANPDNICFVHTEGNKAATDAAFAKADHIVKQTFNINRVTAATMEPRGSVGVYDQASDRYTVYTTLQRALDFREKLSETLRVPESRIRVVAGDIGGSFGMKSGVYNEVGLVLLAAKVTGRPVKWNSTRTEAFLSDAAARDNVTEAQLALDKNGKFLGMRIKTLANLGAYVQPGSDGGPVSNLGTLAGIYTTPAIDIDVTAVFSHTHWMRPYRGNGRPEAAYVLERLIDCAAQELGFDPVELRRKNIIPYSALPYQTALSFKYDSGRFEECMDMCLKMADWKGFEKRRAEARKRGKLRGIGISNSIEKAAAPGIEGAEIRFDRTGSMTIIAGSVSHGQGHETVFKQLVCDKLGLDPKDVHYEQGDTDIVFYGEGTGGSRTSAIGGTAMLMAAEKIIAKARKIAAHVLQSPEGDINFADGLFRSKAGATISMQDVVRTASKPERLPDGMEPGLNSSAVYNAKTANFPSGTHICELEIDEETGQVDMIAYHVVDDVGNVMNPLLLKGQIHGGIAQGVGQMEDLTYDKKSGELLAASFMDYAMPHADTFCSIEVKSNPDPTSTNPLGVKGAGEAGCVGALPAVANALVDALSPFKVRDVPMPATPQVLWRVMRDARVKRN